VGDGVDDGAPIEAEGVGAGVGSGVVVETEGVGVGSMGSGQ
jgi:hypothetical protein